MESQRGGSKKKNLDANEKTSLNYLLPPWPEWNDLDVNSEKWDASTDTKIKTKSLPSTTDAGFENPLGHGELPHSLNVSNWVRPTTFMPEVTFSVTECELGPCEDFVTPNLHLLHSEFVRAILSSIANLLCLSHRKPFGTELESPTFSSTGGKIWQPWHHVYSMCKVGKDQTHRPMVNPTGKYIVRLFYMGAWRKIVVDDYLPLDLEGKLLLPITSKCNELWLMILTKALFRIGSLTWTTTSELVDFNVTVCLTGWLNYNINCKNVSSKYIWSICQKYLMADDDNPDLRYKGLCQNLSASQLASNDLFKENTLDVHEIVGPVAIFGVISDLTNFSDAIEGISPCVEHAIMITETITVKCNDRPPTPLWKTFRWKTWALKKGLIDEYKPPYEVKSVRVFSSMKSSGISLFPEEDLFKLSLSSSHSQTTEDSDFVHEIMGKKIRSNHKASKKNSLNKKTKMNEGLIKENNNQDEFNIARGDKRSKAYKDKSNKKPAVPVELTENLKQTDEVETWVELDKLIPHLNYLEIFFRPSNFSNNLKISDVSQLTSLEKTSTGKRLGKEPDESAPVNKSKNDYFYLFIDSMYSKKVFISLTILPDKVEQNYAQRVGLQAVSKTSFLQESDLQTATSDTGNFNYHISGEEYNWRFPHIGKEVFTLSTNGTRSLMLQLKEGICIIKFWLKLPRLYNLHIMTQVPFIASTLEVIQEQLVAYSSSIRYFGDAIMKAFAALNEAANTGSADITDHLETFKVSYSPPYCQTSVESKHNKGLENTFEKAMLLTLRDNITEFEAFFEVLMELQKILLKPSLGVDILEDTYKIMIEADKSAHKLVSVPQAVSAPSFLEGWRINKEGITPKSREQKKQSPPSSIKKTLKKEKKESDPKNKVISLFLKNSDIWIDILLRMFQIDRSLLEYYPFRRDLDLKLVYTDYNGTLHSTPNLDWLPLLRFIVNFHSNTPTLCAFNFHSSLPDFHFKVINNDTSQEIPRNLIEVLPSYYTKNDKGYTLLGYGFFNQSKNYEVSWKLRILAENEQNLPHYCKEISVSKCSVLQPPKLCVKELRGYYIPNSKKIICSCFLKTKIRQFITLRLVLSNDTVPCVLGIKKLSEDCPEIEAYGKGNAIIPIMELDTNDDSTVNEIMEFHIEAKITTKNWPISTEDESFIQSIREKMNNEDLTFLTEFDLHSIKLKSPKSSSLFLRQRSLERFVGAPFWKIQLITDSDKSAYISLELDTRREESLRQLKRSWEEAEPGRQKRAFELRQEFLNRMLEESKVIPDETTSTDKSKYFISELGQFVREDENAILLEDCLKEREDIFNEILNAFLEENKIFINQRQLMINDQLKVHEILNVRYLNQKEMSVKRMDSVYEMRKEYINSCELEKRKIEQKNKKPPKEEKKEKNKTSTEVKSQLKKKISRKK